ncbi:MAG: hypothetical protein OXC83_01290 [Chloroflexi bacterium]|nr:hypothetical protein [Chloroflexota bacterium]
MTVATLWFPVFAGMTGAALWVPAFAGMTGKAGITMGSWIDGGRVELQWL